jgi:NAD(P)H-hydrate epimerase
MAEIEKVTSVPRLPKRAADGHKGLYGHVLIVGGSRGMLGAVAMATNSALRGGAGLATFAAPEHIQIAIATLCPCATSIALECDAAGNPAPNAVSQMLSEAQKCDVLAIGPGMGVGNGQSNLVRAALAQDKPLVIDADGLNNLAKIADWPSLRKCPLILTPHPGEFGRLTGKDTKSVQSNREKVAIDAVRSWQGASAGQEHASGKHEGVATGGVSATPSCCPKVCSSSDGQPLALVLKGQGTVVTDGQRIYINTTGNPGMATGGSGDILTGLTAALLGQRLPPFEAACLAVFLHGRAGDLAAQKLGEAGMIAWDLLDFLPAAIKER